MARRALPAVSFALLLMLAAGVASAAGGEHGEAGAHGPSWGLLALQILNTAVLVGVLVSVGRRPIGEFFAARQHAIRASIEGAKQELEAAERRLAELRARLSGIGDERARMIAEAEELARIEERRSTERARRTAERIREEAGRVAEQELARARRELRAEAAALATDLAAERLREAITPEDDRRLVREFIERSGGPA
jgi:F-type H+-transporting ATPase subunit b